MAHQLPAGLDHGAGYRRSARTRSMAARSTGSAGRHLSGAFVFKINGKLRAAHKVMIPARPFLGISSEDRSEIPLLVQDVLDSPV
jgi:phage gpG-like protein